MRLKLQVRGAGATAPQTTSATTRREVYFVPGSSRGAARDETPATQIVGKAPCGAIRRLVEKHTKKHIGSLGAAKLRWFRVLGKQVISDLGSSKPQICKFLNEIGDFWQPGLLGRDRLVSLENQ